MMLHKRVESLTMSCGRREKRAKASSRMRRLFPLLMMTMSMRRTSNPSNGTNKACSEFLRYCFHHLVRCKYTLRLLLVFSARLFSFIHISLIKMSLNNFAVECEEERVSQDDVTRTKTLTVKSTFRHPYSCCCVPLSLSMLLFEVCATKEFCAELNYHFAKSAEGIFISLNDVKIVPLLTVTQRREKERFENSIYFCLVPANFPPKQKQRALVEGEKVREHTEKVFTLVRIFMEIFQLHIAKREKSSVRMNTFQGLTRLTRRHLLSESKSVKNLYFMSFLFAIHIHSPFVLRSSTEGIFYA